MKRFHVHFVILSSFFLIFSFSSFAQKEGEKIEREISIKEDQFPEKALKLAAPILKKAKKTKYYKELSEMGDYYEFKSDYKGEQISVKFNEKGELIDIEILKKLKDFPKDIQQSIEEYFNENYEKHRLIRIQIQYNREVEFEDGELEQDEDDEYIKEFLEMDLEDLIVKYEIEAEVKTNDNNTGFFEFLFDDKGKLELKRAIVTRADDNVLY